MVGRNTARQRAAALKLDLSRTGHPPYGFAVVLLLAVAGIVGIPMMRRT